MYTFILITLSWLLFNLDFLKAGIKDEHGSYNQWAVDIILSSGNKKIKSEPRYCTMGNVKIK